MSILLMCTGSFQVIFSKTLSEALHGLLLGSQEVSSVRKQMVHQALAAFRVSSAERVPVLGMNAVGPFLAGQELYSFTADGIWLNEKAFNEMSLTPEQELSLYYHEAAHYAAGHHKKILLHILPLPVAYWGVYKLCAHSLKKYEKKWQICATVLASLVTTYLYTVYHLHPLSEQLCQDAQQQADLMVCKARVT